MAKQSNTSDLHSENHSKITTPPSGKGMKPLAITSKGMATQAERIVRKFGGPYRLAKLLSRIGKPRDIATIYRWMYPKSRGGTGGVIPARSLAELIHVARVEGVFLTASELDPRGGELSRADHIGDPMGELEMEPSDAAADDDIFG